MCGRQVRPGCDRSPSDGSAVNCLAPTLWTFDGSAGMGVGWSVIPPWFVGSRTIALTSRSPGMGVAASAIDVTNATGCSEPQKLDTR